VAILALLTNTILSNTISKQTWPKTTKLHVYVSSCKRYSQAFKQNILAFFVLGGTEATLFSKRFSRRLPFREKYDNFYPGKGKH
jgi:hypothetical protein